MKTIGERLRKFRTLRGLSAEEVARRLKVSPSTYRDWEMGRAIKGEPYVALASILEVSLPELFGTVNTRTTDLNAELDAIAAAVKRLRSML